MWFGVADGGLESTAIRPVQFQDIWSRSGSVSPERALALAVVQEALNDLARHRFAKGRRRQRLYWQAYAWIAADDRTWPYSFVNICEAVGLPVEQIRQQLLDARPPNRAAEGIGPEAALEATLGKAA